MPPYPKKSRGSSSQLSASLSRGVPPGIEDRIYPWGLFILFLAGNALLAYSRQGMILKLWIFAALILLPLSIGIAAHWRAAGETPPLLKSPGQEKGPASWFFVLVILTALFFRFFRVDSLSAWPRLDEGLLAFESLEILRTWEWNTFYAYCDHLPAYPWAQALFFKSFGISLGILWLFPAVLSTLTLAMAYLGAREYFSKNFSALLAALIAGAFWPAYTCRFSHLSVLMVLWEVLTFLALGSFLREDRPTPKLRNAALLGICVALGFYTYPAYLAVAALTSFTVLAQGLKRREAAPVFAFALPVALGLIPLASGFFKGNSGNYFRGLSTGVPDQFLSGQMSGRLSYLGGIFWGQLVGGDYGPIWGGFLNPLTASFFFLGLLECFRYRKHPLSQWLLVGLALALLPGFCTNSVEFFRIVAFWPLGYLTAAWGFILLVSRRGNPRSIHLLPAIGLILASTCLDYRHLFIKYPQAWGEPNQRWSVNIKSAENWAAYRLLRDYAALYGPGAVLEDLETDTMDRTLTIAVHGFDAALNQGISPRDIRWMAVIVNTNYTPFLRQRFSQAVLTQLPSDDSAQYGGDVLAILPREPGNSAVLSKWFQTNQEMQQAGRDIIARKSHGLRTNIIRELTQSVPSAQGDPLLESIRWEKVHVQVNLQAAYGDIAFATIYPDSLRAIQNALHFGVPAAHLYNELGVYLALGNRTEEAKRAFEGALKSPVNVTPARRNLDRLQSEAKK